MASRADRKRWVRQLAQIRRGFELYDDTPKPPPKFVWDLGVIFVPMAQATRKCTDALRQFAAKMRELSQAAKKAAYVRRLRPEYPRPVPPSRPPAKSAHRPGAFRLPRGGGRWSLRS